MSTSFLTRGRYSRPALTLGFDPREVVRRAIITGRLQPAPPATPEPVKRPVGRPAKYHTEAEREAALKAAYARADARRKGQPAPLLYTHRPELAGLKGRAYHLRYLRLYRAGLLKPAP